MYEKKNDHKKAKQGGGWVGHNQYRYEILEKVTLKQNSKQYQQPVQKLLADPISVLVYVAHISIDPAGRVHLWVQH